MTKLWKISLFELGGSDTAISENTCMDDPFRLMVPEEQRNNFAKVAKLSLNRLIQKERRFLTLILETRGTHFRFRENWRFG